MIFQYGANGLVGFTLNGTDYVYQKNIFGDIIGIFDTNQNLITKYTYDSWGNCQISVDNTQQSAYNVAVKNPFRYRGYYYDTEIGLYYLNSRYYDPEIGRFINADDISYVNAEMLNGLNLYAYCGNNPFNDVDFSGNLSWWQWLLFGIGAALVVASIVVLSIASGGTLTGLAGAIIVGAANGALIGAAVGTVAGGIIGGAVSDWSIDGILTGMAIGFGVGAVVGAITGAIYSGATYGKFISKDSLLQHFDKHGKEFGELFNSSKEYANGAKYVINNGTYIKEMNGYIKFFGAQGKANYAFVGLKRGTYRVVTFGLRSVADLAKYITWLGM